MDDRGPARGPPGVAVARAPLCAVLAEGNGWIVVAKPPNLLTHRNDFTPREPAAVQSVRDMIGKHVFPIHRLDRGASGCLLFSTEQSHTGALAAAFAEGQKTYLAFVRGNFVSRERVFIDRPMADDKGIVRDARSWVTRLAGSDEPRCSLLHVAPETGRYHQVRRHVRDLTHPIIGDGDHGDHRQNKAWAASHGVTRLGLHCATLSVPWVEPIEVRCPLFEDHDRLFRSMPWWEEALAAMPELALAPVVVPRRGSAPAPEPRADSPDE